MKLQFSSIFSSAVFVSIVVTASLSLVQSQSVEIGNAKFEFPNPAFPYYHFVIEADLSGVTYVDATVRVNGSALRFTEMMTKSEFDLIDLNHPAIAYRPPSAYALSENNQKYRDMSLPEVIEQSRVSIEYVPYGYNYFVLVRSTGTIHAYKI